jgi:hypothetical protein
MNQPLRSLLLFLTIMVVAAAAQTSRQGSFAKITASAVWQPPQEIFVKASKFCQTSAGPASFSVCYMNQLAAQGEPPDAVQFTRWLFDHFDQNVGIMTAFKSYAPVDAAQVMIPLRANDNYALLLLNGDPSVINVDDFDKLDRKAMEADPLFQSLQHRYPKIELFPGDRSGSAPWPRVEPLPAGGTRFIVSYPLLNGCHACAPLGVARFGWDFDDKGKFLRTTYISTPPPPKLTRPTRTPPPPSQ